MKIQVQASPFDLATEVTALYSNNPRVGAVATFLGLVRDVNAGEGVHTLSLEHYPGMTERSLAAIVAEACARWSILDATVIHRVGDLRPTDPIVMVAVAAAHRGEAFAACEYIMDFLKTRAPFWKKEGSADGERWVDARDTDAAAAQRWADQEPAN